MKIWRKYRQWPHGAGGIGVKIIEERHGVVMAES
jgi:hypothetical protein